MTIEMHGYNMYMHIKLSSFYRCTAGVESWAGDLVKATNENIANAVEWVRQTPPQTPPIRTNVVEATIKALSLSEVSVLKLWTLDTVQDLSLMLLHSPRLTTSTSSPKTLLVYEHLICYWKK